jgi:AcrR family transcriptional regulator
LLDPAENRSLYAPIPSGQHGLAPELVSADQRARLNAAMVQVVADAGYVRTTVEDVLSRAGVSRRTFYEHYDNKQDCFVAACEDVLGDWRRHGARAYHQAVTSHGALDTVSARLRGGLQTLFGLVASDPLGARVIFLETLNCGSPGLRRLERAVDELEQLVERAVRAGDGPPALPRGMVTVIVGGVLEIVTVRLRHGRTDELLELAEPLLQWMLSYRSPEAAARVTRAREASEARVTASDTPVAVRGGERGKDERGGLPLWRDGSMRPIALRDARARIIEAAAQIASDRGFGALSINEIDRAAGVSHHTFHKHFKTKDEAFVAAYRAGGQETMAYSLKAYSAESEWPDAVRAGLAAELRFLAMRPALARIGFLEVYAAGPEALALRETELQLFTAALEPGYGTAGSTSPPDKVVSEAIAGGIYQLMREFVLHHGPEGLLTLAPDATFAALAPFIGAAAAAIVAAKPVVVSG